MTRYIIACLLGLTLCTCSIGCGGNPTGGDAGKTEEELNQANSKEELKKRLLEIAETGEAGSSVMGMRESIEEVRKADSSIGDEILTLCEQLEAEGSPKKVKSIAKKMADLL